MLEIYISGQVDTLKKHLNFRIQAKSSAVAGKLFQILTMLLLSNIYTTVTYKQFIKVSTCCFILADKEILRVIQIINKG